MPTKTLISNTNNFFLLLTFSLGLFSCKVKDLQYLSIAKVDNVKMSFQKTTADVYFKVYNPNSFTLNVDSVNAALKQEDNAIGHIVSLGKIAIPAKDSSIISLNVSLKTGVAALSLIQYLGKNEHSSTTPTFIDGFGWVTFAGLHKKIFLNQQVFPTPQ